MLELIEKNRHDSTISLNENRKFLLEKLSSNIEETKRELSERIDLVNQQTLTKIAEDMLELKLELIADIETRIKEALDHIDTLFMQHETKIDNQIDTN